MTATNTFAQTMPVAEKAVEIKTPDGTAKAMFIHPTTGTHPGVLVWPDAFGLRPAMRDIGARIAAEGYAVLVPNPFYRSAMATVDAPLSTLLYFGQPERHGQAEAGQDRSRPLKRQNDAAAYIAFFDASPRSTRRGRSDARATAWGERRGQDPASLPDRVGAGASFHGGGRPTHPTALIVGRRRSKRGCISGSQPTTTAVSRVRRTS